MFSRAQTWRAGLGLCPHTGPARPSARTCPGCQQVRPARSALDSSLRRWLRAGLRGGPGDALTSGPSRQEETPRTGVVTESDRRAVLKVGSATQGLSGQAAETGARCTSS